MVIIKINHLFFRLLFFFPAVHYRAWTESTLHKFEDTWHEQQPLELVLGKGLYKGFAIFLYITLANLDIL